VIDDHRYCKGSGDPAPLKKNGTSYKRSAELAEAGSGPPVEAALIAISHSTTAASIAK
jgi:hypothetical protein